MRRRLTAVFVAINLSPVSSCEIKIIRRDEQHPAGCYESQWRLTYLTSHHSGKLFSWVVQKSKRSASSREIKSGVSTRLNDIRWVVTRNPWRNVLSLRETSDKWFPSLIPVGWGTIERHFDQALCFYKATGTNDYFDGTEPAKRNRIFQLGLQRHSAITLVQYLFIWLSTDNANYKDVCYK